MSVGKKNHYGTGEKKITMDFDISGNRQDFQRNIKKQHPYTFFDDVGCLYDGWDPLE